MAEKSTAANYEVLIEGKAHPWDKDTISVADIRQLGDLPQDAPVVEEDLRDGSGRTLSDDEILHPGKLEEGKRPTKRVNFRRGWPAATGRVMAAQARPLEASDDQRG